jgi:hypothetical protein
MLPVRGVLPVQGVALPIELLAQIPLYLLLQAVVRTVSVVLVLAMAMVMVLVLVLVLVMVLVIVMVLPPPPPPPQLLLLSPPAWWWQAVSLRGCSSAAEGRRSR